MKLPRKATKTTDPVYGSALALAAQLKKTGRADAPRVDK